MTGKASASFAPRAARAAQDSTAFRALARVGYVVLGVIHLVIGVIAISIAQGGGGDADQGGAVEQIRRTPAGVLLLWVIVVGLLALAVWQIAGAFVEQNASSRRARAIRCGRGVPTRSPTTSRPRSARTWCETENRDTPISRAMTTTRALAVIPHVRCTQVVEYRAALSVRDRSETSVSGSSSRTSTR